MAIYHFHGQVISRSAGRSSVAAAAYRSAERLVDERTDLTHDFSKKAHDVFYQEILTPDKAPEWMKDRGQLWNEIEKAERRKDAQLAREFNIALPRELTDEQNIELARQFVQKNFVDKGMVADLCLHHGHNHEREDGEDQPHIHVMVTLREITPEGFGQKVREWNNKELLNEWRREWAQEANFFLALNGHDLRIDHRRLEEQGIELEPQTKIGSKAAYSRQARYEEHQQIARENGERIYQDPMIALNALIHQQSTFTHHNLAKFINRHTADREQFDRVYHRVKGNREIVFLGRDDFNSERFTTREMLEIELQMVKRAVDQSSHANFAVSERSLEKALKDYALYDEQKAAFYHVTDNTDLACVVGYAGTGKSYMLGAAREAWEQDGYCVQGMAVSGKAAENLEQNSGIRSHTIANRLINWEHDRERLTSRDIIVVDEAAMVGSRDMAKIIQEAYHARAKVVLVGDQEQIQAIMAGAAFRAIIERVGYAEMIEVSRQKEAWQREATKAFALGQTAEGLLAYEERGHVHSFNTQAIAVEAMIAQWDETRSNQPDKTSLMMAYTRADVQSLNERAREIRQTYGELGETHTLQTTRGQREFAEHDRLYFLQNDKTLHVKNGTLGTIRSIDHQGNLVIDLDREPNPKGKLVSREIQFNIKDYNAIEHGYAATIHKAQGSTVDYSYILASKYLDRHVTYPAMSRHRENSELYYSREEFKDFRQLSQTLGRENRKEISLDYLNYRQDYAQTRGFEEIPDLSSSSTLAKLAPVHSLERGEKAKPLSTERLRAAETRLAERRLKESFAPEIRQFEKDTGRKVSLSLAEGDQGTYRGTIKFGEARYGMLETKDEIKLVPYKDCHNLDRGREAKIEKTIDNKGHELHRAVPVKERTRERDLGLDLER